MLLYWKYVRGFRYATGLTRADSKRGVRRVGDEREVYGKQAGLLGARAHPGRGATVEHVVATRIQVLPHIDRFKRNHAQSYNLEIPSTLLQP